MLFNRYKEVTERCLELGSKMDTLTNEEGAELRRLLEEKSWLSKTIARHAKSALEEARQSFELIDTWISEASGKVEQALDQSGTPSDMLALEDITKKAAELRDRARNLMTDGEVEGQASSRADTGTEISYHGDKEYPQAADVRIDLLQEIDSAAEEVAASAAEPLSDVPPEGDNTETEEIPKGKKEKESQKKNKLVNASEQQKCISLVKPQYNVTQSPEPMTYKLPQEVVASLEEKLRPELLPKPISIAKVDLPVQAPDEKKEKNLKSQKTKGKKSKRKKK